MWRLILEVQHARMTLRELTALLVKVKRAARRVDFGRVTNGGAPLHDACAIAWVEMLRAGLIEVMDIPAPAPAPPSGPPTAKGAAGYDYDPDAARDQQLEHIARMIARAHQRR